MLIAASSDVPQQLAAGPPQSSSVIAVATLAYISRTPSRKVFCSAADLELVAFLVSSQQVGAQQLSSLLIFFILLFGFIDSRLLALTRKLRR